MTIMYEVRQKISNHPINEEIERYVIIRRIADNADVELINFRNFDVIKTFKMVKILHL